MKSVPSRCTQNPDLRKRKDWVKQAGPRALSAGWLGNNISNRKKNKNSDVEKKICEASARNLDINHKNYVVELFLL